jgi:iron complex transport system ATP-binding protein
VVTHDLNLAAEFSHYVLLMKHGRGLAFGAPAEVLTPELLKKLFNVQILVDSHPVTGVPRITPVHQSHR